MIVKPEDLNGVMDVEHVIRVHADGSVTPAPNVNVPECYIETRSADDMRKPHISQPWGLLNGYSGQDNYPGPIMHTSEYVGAAMARDILAEPGLYVVVLVGDLSEEADEEAAERGGESRDVGWAVAHRAD